MYAANGFAALAFDKRGTGGSEGKYLQNFHVLSDDVVAAVRWLRTQPGDRRQPHSPCRLQPGRLDRAARGAEGRQHSQRPGRLRRHACR